MVFGAVEFTVELDDRVTQDSKSIVNLLMCNVFADYYYHYKFVCLLVWVDLLLDVVFLIFSIQCFLHLTSEWHWNGLMCWCAVRNSLTHYIVCYHVMVKLSLSYCNCLAFCLVGALLAGGGRCRKRWRHRERHCLRQRARRQWQQSRIRWCRPDGCQHLWGRRYWLECYHGLSNRPRLGFVCVCVCVCWISDTAPITGVSCVMRD